MHIHLCVSLCQCMCLWLCMCCLHGFLFSAVCTPWCHHLFSFLFFFFNKRTCDQAHLAKIRACVFPRDPFSIYASAGHLLSRFNLKRLKCWVAFNRNTFTSNRLRATQSEMDCPQRHLKIKLLLQMFLICIEFFHDALRQTGDMSRVYSLPFAVA